MRIIDWNIKYKSNIDCKITQLKQALNNNCIIMLQEVVPDAYKKLLAEFGNEFNFCYSLNHRVPTSFDTDERRLGLLIMIHKSFELINEGVIERNVFPDRTIYAEIKSKKQTYRLLNIHSITGCSYYKAKSSQYNTCAEFINDFKPDIICIDANEPDKDSLNIEEMIFFKNGPGAKVFFEATKAIGLSDAYSKYVKENKISDAVPPFSCKVKRRGNVRYDFVFVKNSFLVNYCKYEEINEEKYKTDHSLIVVDVSC